MGPTDVQTAEQYLGTNDFNNYCEAFVELASQGKTGLYKSAIQAWNNFLQNGQAQTVTDINNIPVGSVVYFGADKSNNGYGHTGIYEGNGKFISATYNGVREADLGQWIKSTGQKLLGYVPQGSGSQITQQAQQHGSNVNGLLTNQQYRQLAQYQSSYTPQNVPTNQPVPNISMPTPTNPASQGSSVPNVMQQTGMNQGNYGSQASSVSQAGLVTMPTSMNQPRSTQFQAPAPTPLTQGGYATPVTTSGATAQQTPDQQEAANNQAALNQAQTDNSTVTPISTGLPSPQTYTFGNISVQF